MEHQSISQFLDYAARIRQRTMKVARLAPPDQIEWSYAPGKFTLGDLMRHLAAIERFMFAENVAGRPSRYSGCGRELADGKEAVLDFMERLHEESTQIFASLTDTDLLRPCTPPSGAPLATWKWLRAMIEHEAHHRGQIYLYLAMLGVDTPPLYGLTSEEVAAMSEK